MSSQTLDLRTEVRTMLRLSWPIVLTQLFIMLTGTIDAAMAGNYASVDLAGVSLGGMFLWPAFMLMTGFTMALTPIISQLRGARREAEIGHQIRQGMWVCGGTASVLVIFLTQAGAAFSWVDVDPEAGRIATDYLAAVAWGAPPIIFYVGLRHICEGLGHPRPPMLIAAAMIPLNAFLNYVLIYGKFGFPELGGVGSGYATATIFWVELILMMFVCRMPFFRALNAFNTFEAPNWQTIGSILMVGVPIGLTIFAEMAVFSVVGLLIAGFGVIAVAANSVAGNINWATYVIPSAIGNAASIRVGYHVGAENYAAARALAGLLFKFSIGYAVAVGLLLIFSRFVLVGIFTQDTEVIHLAATLLIFIAVYQLVDDTNAVTIGALRGYKDTRIPFYFSLVGYWVIAVPLGYALSEEIILPGLAPGVYGYWVALTLGLFIVATCTALRLWAISGNNEKIRQLAST